MENGFSELLHRNMDVIGPDHNANFVTDDAGQYWMLYHGFDAAEPDVGRKVYLDRIEWDADGWPMVKGDEPSSKAEKPMIRKRKE